MLKEAEASSSKLRVGDCEVRALLDVEADTQVKAVESR